jgi:hypothetical protein
MKQITEMKKTAHVVFKHMCRSLLCTGVGGVTPFPLITTLFPSRSVDISYKDDVTVILLLGASCIGDNHVPNIYEDTRP